MSNLYVVSSRMAWSLALACAVLAVVAAGGARADDPLCTYGAMSCADCSNPAIMDPTLCAQQCGGQCGGGTSAGCTPSNCSGCTKAGNCLAQVCTGSGCGCNCNAVPPLFNTCSCQ